MSRPSISLVMATWNGAAHLEPQLRSLADQTLRAAELVVCDDVSTDKTVPILQAFAKGSPFPVRIYLQEVRVGYAQNFAQAAKRASGDLLVLADQDDLWHPQKLEAISAAAQFTQAGVLCHDFEVFESGGETVRPSFFAHLADHRLPREICVKGCAMAVSRAFADQWGWPLGRTGISHDFWVAFLATAVGDRAFLDTRLIRHRLHDANASGWIPDANDRVPQLAAALGRDASDPLAAMIELFLKPGRERWIAPLRQALRERASPDQAARAADAVALLDIADRWLSPTP